MDRELGPSRKERLTRMVSDPGVLLPREGAFDRRLSEARTAPAARMRVPQRTTVPAEDTLAQIALDAESRLAAKRRERAERRTIKLAEIKRRQTIEEEERKAAGIKSPSENGDGMASSASSTSSGLEKEGRLRSESQSSLPKERAESFEPARPDVLPRSGSASGRRGSDASSHSNDADGESRFVAHREHKELKQKFSELEEKFKKCMLTNEQLDNEKSALAYKLDLYQDKYDEQTEHLAEAERMRREKAREVDRGKREIAELERNVGLLRLQLQQRQDLIEEHGLVLIGGEIVDVAQDEGDGSGDANKTSIVGSAALVTPAAAALLQKSAGVEGTLDARLRQFAVEKEELRETVRRLKAELETSKASPNVVVTNGLHNNDDDPHGTIEEIDDVSKVKEDRKKLEESKLKLAKAELEMTNLEATVARLEQQIKRHQELLVESERSEEEQKTEKRKLQRELRDAMVQVEELTTANKHLQTRLEKVRAVKGNLQSELNKPI